MTSAIATKWGFWDFIVQPLAPIVLFLAALAFFLGGLYLAGGYIYWLFTDAPDKEQLWRRKATAAEATATARPGRIKLIKSETGFSGKGHAGPSFSFYGELAWVEGLDSVEAFKHIGFSYAAEFGPGKSSFRLRDLSLKDSLVNRLINLSLDQGVPRESIEFRPANHVFSVTIPASVKVDPAVPPQVVIAEAEGVRLWCSVLTEEEFRKLPRAGGRT
jgi:hypothetical protein